jgi:2-polyprenyl-6-methoxyphenol hydroxylase-like FAD-dependent oxidoreductase
MKICISGAGIAGPSLAYWLLHHGHEPTLVEMAPRFREGGYIIDFWGKGYELAERMGLTPRLLDAGYKVREVRIVDEQGRRAGGFHTESMVKALRGRFVSLPRGELARIIYDSIKDRVETLFDNSIVGLEDSAGEVQVTFSRTPPRAFDLVIGADGLHSKVRTIGFPSDAVREDYIGYHVAAFEVTGYRPRDELTYVSFSRPGRQIARFAMRDDRTVFMLIFVAPQPLEAADRAVQQAVLQKTFGGLGWECDAILTAMTRADSLYFDRVSQIHAPRWSRGRVALLGDAAHCPSLLAGEGCGLAIIDAYVLAGEIAATPQDHSRAFHDYERRLRPFIEGKQRAARQFAGQFAPRTEFGIWLRNWATRAMSIPGISNLFIGRSLRDSVELPNY